ncbi:TrbG/VirB9 family P-type conjugative transfer protein [Massilia sp. erpn]|uniref:TrbG/VirB9 family P-type conjugative transfer protein n=1 Tax=Massilia sp. erpn TaxID=2738142 RepID=UPI0021057B60|nr:TrbG/VirB9 family P-type conjugative transfer protein [Massilia sp. erpn]UTY55866.1 TrbG/VirB9 family P-type conjugative transfer protein [Massilia sp. erpn]
MALACAGVAGAAAPKRAAPVADEAAKATPAPKENRIVTYNYSPDIIFRLLTLPEMHTHIQLAEDEGVIETPVVGDSLQWRVSGGPRNLYIKPLRHDLETSMTLVTNKRTYQFQLVAGKAAGEQYQKVSFLYPDRELEIRLRKEAEAGAAEAEKVRLADQVVAPNIDPATLDFAFDIEGNARFKPTAVYSNGQFTFLVMPDTQDSPAVFLLDEDNHPSLINYQVKGRMIVVERYAQRLLLKLGAAEVRVTRRGIPNPRSRW